MDGKKFKPLSGTAAAETPAATQSAKRCPSMTRRQAKEYIACLTPEEKQKLNELLKALERKRQPLQVLPHSIDKVD